MSPRHPVHGETPSSIESSARSGTIPAPVLVVDDDPDAIFLIRRLLDRAGCGHPVITFQDSADALAFLRSFTESPRPAGPMPCVMFLDIKMPKVHGFVLLKWVRQQAQFDEMRVAMLSGSDEPSDRLRAEKLGADHYLVKFPPAETVAEVIAAAAQAAA